MKRLYTLSLSTLFFYTFLYPSEHTQSIERRGSLPAITTARRTSLIDAFRNRKKSASQENLVPTASAGMRKRAQSAGDVASSLEKLKTQLHISDSAQERPLTLDLEAIESKYQRAQALIVVAKKEKNKDKKKQLLNDAAVFLEGPRLADHEPSIILLLTEIYVPDFNNRSSERLNSLQRSLFKSCKNDPDLLVYYNALRIARSQEKADELLCGQIGKTLLSLIGVREKKDKYSKEFADALRKYFDDIDARREFVQACSAQEKLDITADAG